MADDQKPAAPAHDAAPEKRTEAAPEVRGPSTQTVTDSQKGVAGAETTWNRDGQINKLAAGLAPLNAELKDGRVTVDNPDPYKNVKGPDGLALSAGPAGTDNAKPATDGKGLIKTDGKIDMPAKKPDGMTDADFEAQRKQVEALNAHMNDPKSQLTDQQKQDLERSTEQMLTNKNPDGSDRRPPLDPKEATKVIEQANRMFDKQDVITGNGFSINDRNMAVTAMVHDVANPNDANQGLNNTCNVSAAAKVEMMTHPGEQAKRYVDMFANENNKDSKGMYVDFPDGKGGTHKVYYDHDSITPDKEAQYAADHVGSGARDSYMQGLNHLYANAVTQQRGEYYTDGKPQFEGDTGERLHKGSFTEPERQILDKNGNPTGRPMTSPGMVAEDVQNVLNQIGAGHMAADFDRFGVGANNGGVQSVKGGDAASLDAAWKANGSKPMVIAVDTNSEMFKSATEVGGKTTGGGHVVTLADQRVNPETGKTEYLLQNSWGDKYNGWVSGDAIASAMNPRAAGGDKSGIVPTASGGTGSDSGANWGNQTYHRPGPASSGDQTSGDGKSYGQEGAPKRDSSGIKTDGERTQEMEYRKQQEQERLQHEAQLKKEQEEQDRIDRENRARAKREEDERFRIEQLERQRKQSGGSDKL
jgi:hypothetical protein